MHIARMYPRGQILIPPKLRERYGLQLGSRLEIREADDHLEIYALPDDAPDDRPPNGVAAFRGSLKAERSLAEQLLLEHGQDGGDHDAG